MGNQFTLSTLSSHRFLLLTVALGCLGVSVIVVLVVLLTTPAAAPQIATVSPTPTANTRLSEKSFSSLKSTPEPTSDPAVEKPAVFAVVNRVLALVSAGQFSEALPFFGKTAGDYTSDEEILTILSRDKKLFSKNDTLVPAISQDDIQVSGIHAQAAVTFTMDPEKTALVRYDLTSFSGNWKITHIAYNTDVTLDAERESVQTAKAVLQSGIYSDQPQQFPLYDSDIFRIEKNVFTMSGATGFQDIHFSIEHPSVSYLVVLYEPPHIRNSQKILSQQLAPDDDGRYSFDIRDFAATNQALLLVYPADTQIDLTAIGIPDHPIIQVPLQVVK